MTHLYWLVASTAPVCESTSQSLESGLAKDSPVLPCGEYCSCLWVHLPEPGAWSGGPEPAGQQADPLAALAQPAAHLPVALEHVVADDRPAQRAPNCNNTAPSSTIARKAEDKWIRDRN